MQDGSMFKILNKQGDGSSAGVSRRAEFIVFAIIVVFVWPIATVGFVGGYGFLVWMSQLVFGPPGPP
jgi:nitrate reductase NapE